MNPKLQHQLSELLQAEVITPETAEKILAYYRAKVDTAPTRLRTIFGVLGALLCGLGIILIIAHNWEHMSKLIKIVLAFLPLVIGQITCALGFFKNKGVTWIESSATFLVLSVGATISLVGQIYHISGSLSDFLLIWITITAPLMYVLRSRLAALLHLVLITWYACDMGYFFNSQTPWWYLLGFVGIIPFYIHLQKENSSSQITGIFNWLLPLSLVLVLGVFTNGSTLSFLTYLALFVLFYNLGQLPLFKRQKLRRNGYAIIGSFGTTLIAVLLTFEWFWMDATDDSFETIELLATLILYTLGMGVLGYLHFKKTLRGFNLFPYAFLIVGALYLTRSLGWAHSLILMNALVIALGLFTIRRGIRQSSYGILNYGLSIITALIICRFFDTKLDFVVRGLLFISVGAGFFFANYRLLNKQRQTAHQLHPKTENHE